MMTATSGTEVPSSAQSASAAQEQRECDFNPREKLNKSTNISQNVIFFIESLQRRSEKYNTKH